MIDRSDPRIRELEAQAAVIHELRAEIERLRAASSVAPLVKDNDLPALIGCAIGIVGILTIVILRAFGVI